MRIFPNQGLKRGDGDEDISRSGDGDGVKIDPRPRPHPRWGWRFFPDGPHPVTILMKDVIRLMLKFIGSAIV